MTLTTYRNHPVLWHDLWDEFFAQPYIENREISPRVEITEGESNYNLRFELPGVDKKDLKVEVDNGVLTVSAKKEAKKEEKSKGRYLNEISYGEYKRSFRLNEEIEAENIKANFENGVLRLELAKKEKAKPKQITVK
ncbi:Hsp20/alpha crystallin family protein [Fibrobacterota bacterium]